MPRLDDLAIFCGIPTFAETLHVGRPNMGNRQRFFERVNDILDRRWLTNDGHCVQEFEHQIAHLIGVKHCIATCNGTVALQIATRAAGLTGDVIVPSMTFIATAHALQWQGMTPVFCDIDAKSHNLDPSRVEELITFRTSGIIGVHLWGRSCDVEALAEIARRWSLKLIFDAAHAFGSSHRGTMIGNFGDAEVLSFHATKLVHAFEGGAVVTNDDALAAKARLMRNFGFSGPDSVITIGTNGKMNEISAAMGLTSLESMDRFISTNYRNYKQYQRELAGIPGVDLVTYDESGKCNYQYIVLEINELETRLSRDHLVDILRAENVRARRYFYPGCHRLEPYCSSSPSGLYLPVTEKVLQRVLCLPTGTGIKPAEVSQICQIIRWVIENAKEVREEMERQRAVIA